MKLNDRNISIYLGQRSGVDPESLYLKPGIAAAQKCSYLLKKGRTGLDPMTGTDSVAYTLVAGYGSASVDWNAPDGNNYQIFCETTSALHTVVYFKNGASRTALTYTDQAGNAITPTIQTHFKPMFAKYNDTIYMATGQTGVFRISPKNGAISAVLTNIPPSNYILVADNRLYIAVGNETYYRWSVIGEPERFMPKLREIRANTYGIDYRLTGASEGSAGNTVGAIVYGPGKWFWSQNDCFVIYGNGNNGQTTFLRLGDSFGMDGLNSCREKDGILYWKSKYKGGALLAATYGATDKFGKNPEKVITEKNVRIAIYSVGDNISDVFQNSPAMTSELKTVAWDSRTDFESIPAAQRTALTTSEYPGYIGIGGATDGITITSAVASFSGLAGTTVADDSGHESTKVYDGYPAYPSTAYESGTYWQSIFTNANATFSAHIGYWQLLSSSGKPIKFNKGQTEIVTSTNAWQTYTFDEPITTSYLYLKTSCNAFYGGINVTFNMYHKVTFAMSLVTGIRLINLTINPSGTTVSHLIGEWMVLGYASSTATLYTEACTATSKAVLQLPANDTTVQTDMGRFYASFVGTNEDGTGGLAISIRAGNTALAAYDTATTSSTTWSNWTDVSTTVTSKNNYLVGFDLKDLVYSSGGAAVKPSTAGLLYVQAKVVFTLNGNNTPLLDAMFFTGYSGSALTSLSPMGIIDDKLCMSILGSASSTRPDTEIVRYDDGEFSVIDGKYVTDYMQKTNGKLYASTGYTYSENHKGHYNYSSADATTSTQLLKEWIGPEESGNGLYGQKLAIQVDEFNDTGEFGTIAIDVATADDEVLYITNGLATESRYPFQEKAKLGNDGNYYFCLNDRTAGTPLWLYKFNTTTRTLSRQVVRAVTGVTVSASEYISSCIDKTGRYIHIVYYDNTTTYVYYKQYDISTETLGAAETVCSTATTSVIGLSIVVADNGVINISFYHTSDYTLWHYYKNPGGSFAGPNKGPANSVGCLFRGYDGNCGQIYFANGGSIYYRKYIDDSWTTAETVGNSVTSPSEISLAAFSDANYDYVVAKNAGNQNSIITAKINGTWSIVKTFGGTGRYYYLHTIMADGKNMLVMKLNDNTANLKYIIGSGTEWGDEQDLASTVATPSPSASFANCIAPISTIAETTTMSPMLFETGVEIGTSDTVYLYSILTAYTTGTADFPLIVSANSKPRDNTIYSSYDLITTTKTIPASRRMPFGKSSKFAISIKSYAHPKIGAMNYTFTEEN